MGVNYLTGEGLVDFLEECRDVVVIDVREEGEYGRGHIVGAINIPIHQFLMEIHVNVQEFLRREIVVFHCQYSAVRGPKAARNFVKQLRLLPARVFSGPVPRVYILEGGFSHFARLEITSSWIEDLDETMLEEEEGME